MTLGGIAPSSDACLTHFQLVLICDFLIVLISLCAFLSCSNITFVLKFHVFRRGQGGGVLWWWRWLGWSRWFASIRCRTDPNPLILLVPAEVCPARGPFARGIIERSGPQRRLPVRANSPSPTTPPSTSSSPPPSAPCRHGDNPLFHLTTSFLVSKNSLEKQRKNEKSGFPTKHCDSHTPPIFPHKIKKKY